jgi:hypothetical protein
MMINGQKLQWKIAKKKGISRNNLKMNGKVIDIPDFNK